MKLLTYHGTIVVRDPRTGCLSHAGLTDPGTRCAAVTYEPGTGGAPGRLPGFDELAVEAGGMAGTVSLRSGRHYACAEPGSAALALDRAASHIWEAFLPVADAEVAMLDAMLSGAWACLDGEAAEAARDYVPAMLTSPFRLVVGAAAIDLLVRRPVARTIAFPAVNSSGAEMRFARAPAASPPREIALAPTTSERRRLDRAPRDVFLRVPETALAIGGRPERFDEPVFDGPGDRDFFYGRYWHGRTPPVGERHPHCAIHRSRDKFVLMQRTCEGIIFDESGTYSEAGYLHSLHACPPGLRQVAGQVRIGRDALDSATRIGGVTAVAFNPHLSNYYHWMVEAVLSLSVISDHMPRDAKVLMPATLAHFRRTGSTGFDHRRIIELLGMARLPIVEVDAAVCRLDEAVWLEGYAIENMPAEALAAFRDKAGAALGRGQPRTRRIFIERVGLRSISNADEVEAFCQEHGFTAHRLEETGEEAQIRLFQEAEFVIATHGAGLSNLLFCAPGTKVIEFSPDTEFRPFFWQIAQHARLRYAVMPCPVDDATFYGKLRIDVGKLARLFRTLERLP